MPIKTDPIKVDVAIIGAGPSGIFSALSLCKGTDLSVFMIDRGPDLPDRDPSVVSHRLYGFSGAGAFSDGKLTLSSQVGGELQSLIGARIDDLIKYVDGTFLQHGAPQEVSGDSEKMNHLQRAAAPFGLSLITFPVRHIGTDNVPRVMASIRRELLDLPGFRMECGYRADSVEPIPGGFKINGKYPIICRKLIVGVGRGGADWMNRGMPNIEKTPSFVDIGVRLEVPKILLDHITEITHDPKFIYYSKSDDKVRTFCVNPGGSVSLELNESNDRDFYTINGHSNHNSKTDMTNMALLTSVSFTEPFNDPFAFGQYVASLSNLLGGRALVQRITDLKRGRRSTPERIARSVFLPTLKEATPGDISFALPHRQLSAILEMIDALNGLVPGIVSDNSYLYSTEVKFYGNQYQVSPSMESTLPGLFVVGDCSGMTRGIMQSCISGLIAGNQILSELSTPPAIHRL